jgi:hypothetical protein
MVGYRTTKETWITQLLAEGLELRVILLETGIPTRRAAAREYAWIELGFALGHPLTNSVRQSRYRARSRLSPVWLARYEQEHPSDDGLRQLP